MFRAGKLLFLCAIFAAAFLQAQSKAVRTTNDSPILRFTQGFILQSLNSGGFVRTNVNHISNLSATNPALLQKYSDFTFGISYQVNELSNAYWVNEVRINRNYQHLPQSAGIVVPFGNFNFGLGYSQIYDLESFYGLLEITTIDYPQGTGKTLRMEYLQAVQKYSLSIGASLEEPFEFMRKIDLGIRVNLYHLAEESPSGGLNYKHELYAPSLDVGINAELSEKISTALYYEMNASFSKVLDETGIVHNSDTTGGSSGNNVKIPVNINLTIKEKLPHKFYAGVLLKVNHRVSVAFELAKIFWSQQWKSSKDNYEFSGSIISNISKDFRMSLGISKTDRSFEQFRILSLRDLKVFYLSAGVNVDLHNFNLDLTFATSRFFSAAQMKQNIAKVALAYSI